MIKAVVVELTEDDIPKDFEKHDKPDHVSSSNSLSNPNPDPNPAPVPVPVRHGTQERGIT